MIDALAVCFIFLGLGLSPLLYLSIALGLSLFYILLTLNTALVAYTQGKYKIGYSGVGGTEGRILLILINIIILCLPNFPVHLLNIFNFQLTLVDFLGIISWCIFAVILVLCIVENLKYLNKIDKKNYKEIGLREYFEKSHFINRVKSSDFGRFLKG